MLLLLIICRHRGRLADIAFVVCHDYGCDRQRYYHSYNPQQTPPHLKRQQYHRRVKPHLLAHDVRGDDIVTHSLAHQIDHKALAEHRYK